MSGFHIITALALLMGMAWSAHAMVFVPPPKPDLWLSKTTLKRLVGVVWLACSAIGFWWVIGGARA